MSDENLPNQIVMPGDEQFRMSSNAAAPVSQDPAEQITITTGAMKTFGKLLVEYREIWNNNKNQLEEFAKELPGEGVRDPKILCFLMLLAVRTERRKKRKS